jgi:hypothetical protein
LAAPYCTITLTFTFLPTIILFTKTISCRVFIKKKINFIHAPGIWATTPFKPTNIPIKNYQSTKKKSTNNCYFYNKKVTNIMEWLFGQLEEWLNFKYQMDIFMNRRLKKNCNRKVLRPPYLEVQQTVADKIDACVNVIPTIIVDWIKEFYILYFVYIINFLNNFEKENHRWSNFKQCYKKVIKLLSSRF